MPSAATILRTSTNSLLRVRAVQALLKSKAPIPPAFQGAVGAYSVALKRANTRVRTERLITNQRQVEENVDLEKVDKAITAFKIILDSMTGMSDRIGAMLLLEGFRAAEEPADSEEPSTEPQRDM